MSKTLSAGWQCVRRGSCPSLLPCLLRLLELLLWLLELLLWLLELLLWLLELLLLRLLELLLLLLLWWWLELLLLLLLLLLWRPRNFNLLSSSHINWRLGARPQWDSRVGMARFGQRNLRNLVVREKIRKN
ncbi:MAG: hypothetical protein JKY56_13375 [Kofleriaceae bacterium]|nr:hypothetical protein [Kofleriaceae bacterium]